MHIHLFCLTFVENQAEIAAIAKLFEINPSDLIFGFYFIDGTKVST